MLTIIHPAADAFKRAQLVLQQDLRELEQAVAHPFQANVLEMRSRLKAILRLMREHFRMEERKNGYMKAVQELDPRFEPELQSLLEEHRAMLQDLEFLVDDADALQQVDDHFSDQVHAWLARYRTHERKEIDLIQEAFDVDVGGEGG